MPKIYLTTQIPQWVQAKLSANLPQFEILRLSSDNLMDHISKDVQALLVRSQTAIHSKLLNHYKDLKIVGTATSGFDHIDLKAMKNKNILAFHTPEANVASAADLTLLHILMTQRNNFPTVMQNKNFTWKNQLTLGSECSQKSLGLLGLGRIGRAVAQRALAFGFKVYFHDPYIEDYASIDPQLESVGRLELFTQCDIISLHTPLTAETRNIIDRHTLDHFGEDKILINCARGELVNTQDLIEALDQGVLKYAGLDTFDTEPLPEHSILRQHPKIFWTPHIGAHTTQAFEKSCMEASQILIQFFSHQKLPPSLLPPNVAWAKNM